MGGEGGSLTVVGGGLHALNSKLQLLMGCSPLYTGTLSTFWLLLPVPCPLRLKGVSASCCGTPRVWYRLSGFLYIQAEPLEMLCD